MSEIPSSKRRIFTRLDWQALRYDDRRRTRRVRHDDARGQQADRHPQGQEGGRQVHQDGARVHRGRNPADHHHRGRGEPGLLREV